MFKVVPWQHKEGALLKKTWWILRDPTTAKDGVRKKEQDMLAGVLEAHTEYSLVFHVCFQSSLITINSTYILTRFGATCKAKQMCTKEQWGEGTHCLQGLLPTPETQFEF